MAADGTEPLGELLQEANLGEEVFLEAHESSQQVGDGPGVGSEDDFWVVGGLYRRNSVATCMLTKWKTYSCEHNLI